MYHSLQGKKQVKIGRLFGWIAGVCKSIVGSLFCLGRSVVEVWHVVWVGTKQRGIAFIPREVARFSREVFWTSEGIVETTYCRNWALVLFKKKKNIKRIVMIDVFIFSTIVN